MEEINKILQEYGLTENEIKVYLSCLKLGISSIYKLIEKTNLPKSTCYDTLKSLESKGLISTIIKENKKHFEAADPEKIIQVLEEKKEKIRKIIPQLKNIKNTAIEKPKIELYHGKEGIKTILESVLSTNKDLFIIGNFQKFNQYLQFYSNIFIKKRLEKKIPCFLIEEKTKENTILKRNDKKELRKTRFLIGLEKSNSECYIYGDNIAILTLLEDEPTGVSIKNLEIANLFKLIFKDLWRSAKP